MPIVIQPYDPDWPRQFAAEREKLQAVLGPAAVAIEHIGSTSVPGLAAKPVIDIMVGVTDLAGAAVLTRKLQEVGYDAVDSGMTGRLFFRKGPKGARTHNLHVVPAAGLAERNEILLRDYLRAHPDAAGRYAALKNRLAGRSDLGERDYTQAKTELIQHLIDLACEERGLPRRTVWE